PTAPDCSLYASVLASGDRKSNASVTLAVAAAQRIVRNRTLAPSAMTSLMATPLAVTVPAASAPVNRRWNGGVMIAGCVRVGVFAATVYSWWEGCAHRPSRWETAALERLAGVGRSGRARGRNGTQKGLPPAVRA